LQLNDISALLCMQQREEAVMNGEHIYN
jgi:hypothetical protein